MKRHLIATLAFGLMLMTANGANAGAQLEPNTQTFVDISTDVKNRVNSGELVAENAPDYMQRRWGISVEEYNNATARARKDEDAYYARKEQIEKSPLAFLGYKPPVPAHLRDIEDEGLLSLPGRFVANTAAGAVGKTVKGIGQVAGIALGEKRTQRAIDLMSQAEAALAANPHTAPALSFLKRKVTDPVLSTAEDITSKILPVLVVVGALGLGKIIRVRTHNRTLARGGYWIAGDYFGPKPLAGNKPPNAGSRIAVSARNKLQQGWWNLNKSPLVLLATLGAIFFLSLLWFYRFEEKKYVLGGHTEIYVKVNRITGERCTVREGLLGQKEMGEKIRTAQNYPAWC